MSLPFLNDVSSSKLRHPFSYILLSRELLEEKETRAPSSIPLHPTPCLLLRGGLPTLSMPPYLPIPGPI
ncbi:hypothetical protein LR48_Vigan1058s000400 [Vigna angularis]|uniref:Uncharacterized protein n=1 Tax=Phaseolus angularis TaxID=3914 RepID=A0A0L9THX4_PHAAN|nr:hypothetical protein LR48_Vigan1058s000400 [Vigna angularis]